MSLKRKIFINLGLVLLGISIPVIMVESYYRIKSGDFNNIILSKSGGGNLLSGLFRKLYRHDSYLGWTPMPNTSGLKWGKTVTLVNDGIRKNGDDANYPEKPLILAVGDSFTFGDEVGDSETWPAILERKTEKRVLNGGVSSYGLDQIVLRAETLIKKYNPDTVILSITPPDLQRCAETVRHGIPRPFFIIENGKLVLKNIPVPKVEDRNLDLFRRIFGYSYVFHLVMDLVAPQYWWSGTMKEKRFSGQNAFEISKLLLKRFSKLSESRKIRTIFVIQGLVITSPRVESVIKTFIEYITPVTSNIEVLNLVPELVKLKRNNRQEFEKLFNNSFYRHMSKEGNEFVAQRIKKILNK